MNPFEYLNAINHTKQNVMVDDLAEKSYNSFMVNRGLSYFPDTFLGGWVVELVDGGVGWRMCS